MKETIRLEEIEGFEELSEDEKEYLRVMQDEAEFRMSSYDHPDKLELVLGIIFLTIYIVYAFLSNSADVFTFYAAVFAIGDLIYLFKICCDE